VTVNPTPLATVAIATPTATPSPSPAPTAQTRATITGRISYPSDFTPPLTVYAIGTTDARTFYSVDVARFPPPSPWPSPLPPPTYTIAGVTPGSYYVVAYRNDNPTSLPGVAVYSHSIACRATPSTCPSDPSPQAITVAGGTTSGIDVGDWLVLGGGQPFTVPPRPGGTSGPTGYVLTTVCRFVSGDAIEQTWLLTCQGLPSQQLAFSLAQQGWTACASAPKAWRKDQLEILITDFVNRSDASGQIEQRTLTTGSC